MSRLVEAYLPPRIGKGIAGASRSCLRGRYYVWYYVLIARV